MFQRKDKKGFASRSGGIELQVESLKQQVSSEVDQVSKGDGRAKAGYHANRRSWARRCSQSGVAGQPSDFVPAIQGL